MSLSLLIVLGSTGKPAHGQTQVKRPEVHAEFGVGVFPWSDEAMKLLESEDTKLLLVGLHRGWNVDKVVDETERPRVRILTAMDELEVTDLVRGRSDFQMTPGFPVIRDADLAAVAPLLELHTAEFVRIFEDNWGEVESFGASLEADRAFPEPENLYRIVVGGVLLGGMIDALFDDQTLMPPPPRRGRRDSAYYVWMVEGAKDSPYLVRQSARVGRHVVFSVGPVPEVELRIPLYDLAEAAPVYEADEARRWRVFRSVFARDYLFPYLKSQRNALLDSHKLIESAKYSAFGEFMGWYYQVLVARVAESLAARGRVETPETSFKYALREGR